jgi:TonB family protein
MATDVYRRMRAAAMVAVIAILGSAAAARAQEVEIAKLARDSAQSLAAANRHSMVVFDFYGAEFPAGADPMSALGEKLAADFRAALAQTVSSAAGAPLLRIENRATTIEQLTTMDLNAGNLRDPNTVRWVYAKTAVDAYITGTVAKASQGYTLTVTLHALDHLPPVDQKSGEPPTIDTFSATIPALADLNALVSDPPRDEFARVPRGGSNGYSRAECIRCAPPAYVDKAALARAEGTVILAATINSHGNVKDIRVKQGMPYGLTERAIEAVREWKLSPAKNEKGKRVAVRQDLTISFALGGPGDATLQIATHAAMQTMPAAVEGAAK